MQIAVLITCYNRKDKTLSCLNALYKQLECGVSFAVYLVDDGSTDGTTFEVKNKYPDVIIIQGTGFLFWNGGMRLAWDVASGDKNYDLYLWLNDDTILIERAFQIITETYLKYIKTHSKEPIIVGSTKDNETNAFSYGGRTKKRPMDLLASKWILPTNKPEPIETFNGNLVLIPDAVFKILGNLDKGFIHGAGDIDYGLRARRLKIPMFIAPGYLGFCSRHTDILKWTDPNVPFKERLSHLNSPKGLPLKQWKILVKRHTGVLWPVYYYKVIIRVIFPFLWKLKRKKCSSKTLNTINSH